jgi:porphyrinogen peroxidase
MSGWQRVYDHLVPSPEPQPILTPLTEAAVFLVLTIDSGSESDVRDLLADVFALTRSVGFRIPDGILTCVVGVGSAVWDGLFGDPRPAGLHDFRPLHGLKHTAVATPGDLFFHIRARRLDLCFELGYQLLDRLQGHARVVDEVHGFQFFEERDLLGFVDGTENPGGRTAFDAVVIGDEDVEFAGGSYLVVQKYVHDLESWDAISVEEQERVIGRTKLSDIELSDDMKPSNSHVALNTIVDESGAQQQIVRRNMPFGRLGTAEFGTYYAGYARRPDVIEAMLTNMFIGDPPGNYDRILDFSTAVTGSLFFVPSSDFLDDPPSPYSDRSELSPSESGGAEADASLGIGSLKGAQP